MKPLPKVLQALPAVFALAALFCLVPLAVQAGDFTYTTNNGTITIAKYIGAGGAVIIPDTIGEFPVTSIQASAFYGSASITNVSIPSSITNIGYQAFWACTKLTAIRVDGANPAYSSPDGVLFDKNLAALIQYPGGKAGNYIVPDTVANIGDYAFEFSGSLTNVTLPASVRYIGFAAFAFCSYLTNLTVDSRNPDFSSEDGVLFNNRKTGLAAIPGRRRGTYTVPDTVSSIGLFAAGGCTLLNGIVLPPGVTSIGYKAFYGCTNLRGVYCRGNAPSVGNSVFVGVNSALVYYLPGTTGWASTFGGLSTIRWLQAYPVILSFGPSFGVRSNAFGFIISWNTEGLVAVDACTDLATATWFPVGTNTLANGQAYFSDAGWTKEAGRVYRVRTP